MQVVYCMMHSAIFRSQFPQFFFGSNQSKNNENHEKGKNTVWAINAKIMKKIVRKAQFQSGGRQQLACSRKYM